MALWTFTHMLTCTHTNTHTNAKAVSTLALTACPALTDNKASVWNQMVGANKGVRLLVLWAQPTKWGYYDTTVQGMTDNGRKVSSRAEKRRRRKQKEEEKKRQIRHLMIYSRCPRKSQHWTFAHYGGRLASPVSTTLIITQSCTLPPKKNGEKREGGEALGGGGGAGKHNNNEEMMKTCIMFYKVCGIVKVSLWHAGTYPPAWHSIVGLQWQQLD